MRLLLFTIDSDRFGIRADGVAEIVRAVAVTSLPGAPTVVEGVIDVRGTVVPVFDLRRRLTGRSRAVEASDHFILVQTARRGAALHVDAVLDLTEIDDRAVTDRERLPAAAQTVAGAVSLADGVVLIHDIDAFLTSAEAESLTAALAAR